MKKMSMFALLLAAVLVTSYSVSGTYAKYTSTYTASDSARVAKWQFSVNDKNMTEEEFVFDLFNTIKDEDGSVEGNIGAANGTDTIIAPGTKGSFEIKIANGSEVDAKYGITFSMTESANIPVEFSLDNATWSEEISALNIADATTDEQTGETVVNQINRNGAEATHTVYWRWVFNGNDSTDTDLGLVGTDTIEVTATITATQIN